MVKKMISRLLVSAMLIVFIAACSQKSEYTIFSLVEIAGVFCLVRLLMMLLDKKRKVSLLSGAVLLLLMFIFLVFLVWGIYQQWRALGEDVGWTLFFGIIPWGVGILIGMLFWSEYKKRLDYF